MATRLACVITLLSLLVTIAGGILATPKPAYAQDDPETIAAQIEAVAAGEPDYTDGFRFDNEVWDTVAGNVVLPFYEAGSFHLWISEPNYIGYSLSNWEAGDFYLEVDTYHVYGPTDNSLGIIFRYVDADNFYYYAISSTGYYALYGLVDGEWQVILDWTESSEIIVGEGGPNWLGVFAVGSQITLLINRTIVDIVEDDTFDYGGIGLAAETYDEAGLEIAFDDLRLWGVDAQRLAEPTTTPAPTTTAAPTSTATPVATSTAEAGAPARVRAITSVPADSTDDFAADNADWALASSDTHTQWRDAGRLNIRVLAPNRIAWALNERTQNLDDFYAEIEMTDIAGIVDSQNGFIFRFQDGDNFYLVGISGQATYAVWRKVAGQWQALIPWTASPHLNPGLGAVNHLGLLVEGPTFTIFANDQLLATVEDTSLAQGHLGLIASTYDQTGVEIAFDNFALWALGSPLAPPIAEQSTPIPTPATLTPSPTETPESAPTVTPQPPAPTGIAEELATLRAGSPTASDEFRRDSERWTFAADGAADMFVLQRELRIRIDEEIVFAAAAYDLEATDFYVEADFRHIGEPTDAEYGFLVRYNESAGDYLSFTIDANGAYQLARQVDNDWEALTEWEDSTALVAGANALNRLGVLARGSTLVFIANDEVIAQIEDSNPQPGTVALMAGSFIDPNVEIAFDNFALWDLAP